MYLKKRKIKYGNEMAEQIQVMRPVIQIREIAVDSTAVLLIVSTFIILSGRGCTFKWI